jgi:hypothetical protein
MLLDLSLIENFVPPDLQIGFEMLTSTRGINVDEETNKPCVDAAATTDIASANLVDLVGDEDPAMSLDLQGWRSFERGK